LAGALILRLDPREEIAVHATLPQLRLAVLNPELAPPFVSDALERMKKRLWYLYRDNGLHHFDSRPNLNRILADREELVRSEPEKVGPTARGGTSTGTGGGETKVGTDEDEWGGGGGAVKGERRLSRVRIRMLVRWTDWNDIYNEVIDPLAQEGADILCDVTIVAKGEAAIRENTVELGIKESLSQRGLNAKIETG
jgi:hypothetical protein